MSTTTTTLLPRSHASIAAALRHQSNREFSIDQVSTFGIVRRAEIARDESLARLDILEPAILADYDAVDAVRKAIAVMEQSTDIELIGMHSGHTLSQINTAAATDSAVLEAGLIADQAGISASSQFNSQAIEIQAAAAQAELSAEAARLHALQEAQVSARLATQANYAAMRAAESSAQVAALADAATMDAILEGTKGAALGGA